ncbi:MAG: disulfide oxidoreductase [Alphaproteobacteria bacterium]|nr:disulfide oxidoreductase [Alphaproteobacteria bacterium]MBO6628398.1 disulfide oxidoreductase [Alphaproteobacteria bacterium]MDF1626060.1 helicase-related protein [Parvibaculaceae bacterium]
MVRTTMTPRARPAPYGSLITAVLGPTNTGKTHLAVERMLAHKTGMIGQPLRLLARETFERIKKRVNPSEVALLTGEEKILPRQARYFVCTVESMPWDQSVDFMAIDEIQLAADRERGHVFTDRLLRARGQEETMFLGSETARPLINKLLPDVTIISRPRLSELSYAGQKKITKLPRRTAIVDFSADRVYAIAELIRRQRGGAAVVMGALSPRTRNAQVALYQNGDVDYLVATDAIGMGLNMDVDHVAFANTSKFDGARHRTLTPPELAQIAGRAGRHMNDGTFGTTGDAPALDPETIERIEDHRFETDKLFQWRNSDLDFSTLQALIRSLEHSPGRDGLTRAQTGVDQEALARLARDPDIIHLAAGPASIALLWDVVQVPDFRKTMTGEHVEILNRIYQSLMSDEGRIAESWIATQVDRLNLIEGDIDTLSNRIAHMRTWTYVANRAGWLDDAAHWQERTRAVEDRLSDALHERLTQRFVDRRTSILMKRLREREDLMASINEEGDVLVEGEFVGKLQGFVFVTDPRAEGIQEKALRAASDKALAAEIVSRATRFATTPASEIHLTEHGRFIWKGHAVGRLMAGDSPLAPRVEVLASEQLNGPDREKVQERLTAWFRVHLATTLEPLMTLSSTDEVTGLAKGVAFQLVEHLGGLNRELIGNDIRALDQEGRGQLRKKGVRFGAHSIFMPALLKPAPARLILVLWALKHGAEKGEDDPFETLPQPPAPGLTSFTAVPDAPTGFYEAIGFRVCGPRAVRRDMLERLADLIRPIISDRRYKGGFVIGPDMMSLMGCSAEEMGAILSGLGYRKGTETFSAEEVANAARIAEAAKAPKSIAPTKPHAPAASPQPPEATTEAATADTPDTTDTGTAETAIAEVEVTAAEPAKVEPAQVDAPVTTPADTAPATETDTTEPQTEAEASAPTELEVWRPQRRHQGAHTARGRDNQKEGQRGNRGKHDAPRGKPAHKSAKGKRHNNDRNTPKPRTERKDKPIDPDSPFAALMALKTQPPGK